MTNAIQSLPPACPICAGAMALKEIHRNNARDGYMCFFTCGTCATIYPRLIGNDEERAFRRHRTGD